MGASYKFYSVFYLLLIMKKRSVIFYIRILKIPIDCNTLFEQLNLSTHSHCGPKFQTKQPPPVGLTRRLANKYLVIAPETIWLA